MNTPQIKTWDIFCRIVDNYGDLGVCARLARQLAHDYAFDVRLWVDDIQTLIQFWPDAHPVDRQLIDNIEVYIWHDEFNITEPADVVIEAFACNLPENYLGAMKMAAKPPIWFNLEYLSAEDWVEGCHGLISTHPRLGLKKVFYFPGFSPKTGGLIKEQDLLNTRDNFLASPSHQREFLNKLGLPNPKDELLVSLFSYDNPTIIKLIQRLATSPQAATLLVTPGKSQASLDRQLNITLKAGEEYQTGSLRIRAIPFLTQGDFDKLLWLCDLNFVRGEDSFVRAQWAGKPFVWQIYPQDDGVHIDKLDAFLARYLSDIESTSLANNIAALWRQWNAAEKGELPLDISTDSLQNWRKHSQNWAHHLNSLDDLTSNMVHFCQKTL